jgi:copper(I)-binding protein
MHSMKRSIPASLLFALLALQAPPPSPRRPSRPMAAGSARCRRRSRRPATSTLKNDGDKPATLTGIDTPAYGMAMIHETLTAGSTAKMVHVDAVEVPAHGTVTFKPKSYHVMLEDARKPVAPGAKVPLALHFADGSTVSVTCDAKAPSYTGQ